MMFMGHQGPKPLRVDKDSTLSDDTLSPPMSNSTTPRPSILGRELHRTAVDWGILRNFRKLDRGICIEKTGDENTI